jgi:hypothetical protein
MLSPSSPHPLLGLHLAVCVHLRHYIACIPVYYVYIYCMYGAMVKQKHEVGLLDIMTRILGYIQTQQRDVGEKFKIRKKVFIRCKLFSCLNVF